MKRIFSLTVVMFTFAARSGQYFQDFAAFNPGDQSFGDGSQLFLTSSNAAAVFDSTLKALQLTDASVANTRAAFLLPDLDPAVTNYAFSARWNAKISGNFTNAGQGFSFNFGQLAALSLTNAAYAQEAGYPTGMCFSVQTAATNSGFYLRINGSMVASLPFNSATQWGVNQATNHLFEMDWNYTNGITVRLNGQTLFTNVWTPGLTFAAGSRFVWAARAGTQPEEVRIDNLIVMTGGNLLPVSMTAPYFKSGEYLPNNQTADKAFDGLEATKWLTQTTTGFVGATSASGDRVARAYSLTTAEDIPTRDPRIWTLQGSTNSGTNWTVCGSGSGFFGGRHETRFWPATNNTSFGAFRLNITTNNGAAEIQLAELKLFEFQSVTHGGGTLLPPTVEASAAYFIGPVSASVDVTSQPNNLPTTTWLQWGTTTNYANLLQLVFIVNTLGGLTPETTYHYRAVASNVLGVAYGSDLTFTTISTNSVDVATPGDVIFGEDGSSPYSQQTGHAFDDSAATKYRNFYTNGGAKIFPFRTNAPVRALTLISADDAPERDPASFVLEGSVNGSSFTGIASNAVPAFAGRRTIQTIPVANATAFVAYRITIPTVQDAGLADSMQIAEIEFLPYEEITRPGTGFVIGPPVGATVVRTGVLDRSLDVTNKLEVSGIPGGGNTTVDIFPGALTRAQGLEWIGATDDTSFPGRTPLLITLTGYDGTNFVPLLSVTNGVPTMDLHIHGYTFSNTTWYQSYRVSFGPPMSGSRLQVGEVRLFGETALPVLLISGSGNQVNVQWRDVPGFHLEYTTDLPIGVWTSNSTPPIWNGGTNSAIIPIDSATKFLRLHQP